MTACFKQFGYDIHTLHYESSFMSATVKIKYSPVPTSTEKREMCTDHQLTLPMCTLKYEVQTAKKHYAQLFTAVLLKIKCPTAHPTLIPSIIFTGTKLYLKLCCSQ